ncbi:MAG: transporter [Deltaproteobacteria bacterium]|nr:transporter [Deltaproteobacteria bacterium]
MVWGISDRQEITFEIPYLSADGASGFGDAVLGTKYQFLKETEGAPGIAGSFEIKLANASQSKGLGTGAMEYDFRVRSQKTWGWFTGIINLGYTIIGEPNIDGVRQARQNVWFTAFAQEFEIFPETKLLSEIYWKESDEPDAPNRFAFDVGFKHQILPHLAGHVAIGKSLREDNVGGPNLRVYMGIKLEFPY